MANGKRIPLIYLHLYKLLIDKFGPIDRVMRTNDFLEVIGRTIHQIPHKYHLAVLKDMCRYDLVEKVDKNHYKLIAKDYQIKIRPMEQEYFLW